MNLLSSLLNSEAITFILFGIVNGFNQQPMSKIVFGVFVIENTSSYILS